MSTPSPSRASTVVGACSLLFGGTSIPFARKCAQDIAPFTTASGILILGSFFGAGLFGALGIFSVRRASFLRDPGFWWRTAMFIAYFALLYTAVIFRQRVRLAWFIIGSLLVLSGIAVELLGARVLTVLSSQSSLNERVAYAAAFLAACIWGVSSALSRKWGMRSGGVAAIPFVFLCAGVLMLPGRWLFGETSTIRPDTWPALIFLCVAPLFGHLCWDVGMRRGNIVLPSLLADTLPWISLTFAQLYLGIPIGAGTW
jgi:drug/metabolite transporter (DMT)-like permease